MSEKFEEDLKNLNSMIKEKKPQLDIDNECAKMKERYGLDSVLNKRGYKNLKKILDKFWSGKRLDDQELTLAYILCPKIILYEDIQFRVFDMVNELEAECKERWGNLTTPMNPSRVVKNMVEANPDYTKLAIPIIDSVWKQIPFEEALKHYEYTLAVIQKEKDE